MRFEELNDTIPYAIGGKEKVLRYSPYPNIIIAMPGRHQKQTAPVGGDFVVMVNDPALTYNGRDAAGEHQFNHEDIFHDVEHRTLSSSGYDRDLMGMYLDVIKGADPDDLEVNPEGMHIGNSINRLTFIHAVQCLAVAEHRRYAQHEKKWGGRYLPFRFAAGIDEGLWTPNDAIALAKKGRPGVEILEHTHGTPKLTQELMA